MTIVTNTKYAFAISVYDPLEQATLCSSRSLSHLTELLVALTEDCDYYQVYDLPLISKI